MSKTHHYSTEVNWTGAGRNGTKNYRAYERHYDVIIDGKPTIKGSSDPAFRGDPACHNPEDLLVAATSSCHMLWYLHYCSVNNIVVTAYKDKAEGIMSEAEDGSGRFEKITLQPIITITATSDIQKAKELHQDANKACFIANSLNCPVLHEATILIAED